MSSIPLHEKTKSIFLFIYFLLITIAYSKAQDSASYNKIYKQTYLETASKDISKALHIADSLFQSSTTTIYKAKSLMLSASLYQQMGNYKKAIGYAERAGDYLQGTGYYDWQVRVYGFLATQYRILKIYTQSKKFSDKALQTIPKIDNPIIVNTTRGLMYQEQAYYYIDQKDYKASVQSIYQSQNFFNQTNADKVFFTANNEQLLGLNYDLSKQYDSALIHYEKGLKLIKNYPDNFMTGLIYNGLASVYMDKENLRPAKVFLDSANLIVDASKNLQLQNEVLKTSEKYYAKTNDISNLEIIKKKQDSVREQLADKALSFVDAHLSAEDTKSNKIETLNDIKTFVLVAAAILLIGSAMYVIYYRNQKRKQIERFRSIIQQLRKRGFEQRRETFFTREQDDLLQPQAIESETGVVAKNKIVGEPEIEEEIETVVMPHETKQKILSALDKFEESNIFTNRNISISFLASHLSTNIKYLSHVINTHKGKDFNNYINELRINYIVRKLNDDLSWRRYKMSVLADEAGFSSHKKFSSVFKSVIGIPPSVFIQYLEEGIEK